MALLLRVFLPLPIARGEGEGEGFEALHAPLPRRILTFPLSFKKREATRMRAVVPLVKHPYLQLAATIRSSPISLRSHD